ncbi:MAG: TetR/AcrR family transcriptional regulator [Anaerocolumna sp.]|jgi:AcrR family transcriptional regulator|nr:TetR/AcrR family transcriptional regulator [Anaerocolumna sp.]
MDKVKIDRRVKLTILILQETLIECMQENHISKISVKQLCEKADINRSTFYAHFQDQYDLLNYTCNEAIENVKKHLGKQQFSDKKPISHQTLTRILEYAKENADLFKALLSENCDLDIQRKIMNEVMVYYPYAEYDERTSNYLSAFGLFGCISILQIWFKDGMPESPSKLSEIIMQAIDKGITSFNS